MDVTSISSKNPLSRQEQWFPNCRLWHLRIQSIQQGPQIPLYTYMQHRFQIYIDGIMVTQMQLHVKQLYSNKDVKKKKAY